MGKYTMNRIILLFAGKYAFLSNFHPCPIVFLGKSYPTSEHAFQSLKMTDPVNAETVRNAPTPGQAKHLGRYYPMRSDWDDKRIDTMYEILRVKFHLPDMKQALLETENAMLIEGNYWNDTFWGMVQVSEVVWEGENILGKILMDIRNEIQWEERKKSIGPVDAWVEA
jgi:hypothetical protein